eukprot:SAG31_NODE_11262_length_1048_cov_1.878820_1_plen_88_part_10
MQISNILVNQFDILDLYAYDHAPSDLAGKLRLTYIDVEVGMALQIDRREELGPRLVAARIEFRLTPHLDRLDLILLVWNPAARHIDST